MIEAPLAFAFAAGLVATINPCGFAMLPAYLSYFMGTADTGGATGGSGAGRGSGRAVGRGLLIGTVVSAGFFLVFGVTGALVTVGIRSVIDYIPWVALAIGVLLALLGAAMLFLGFEIRASVPRIGRGAADRGTGSMFLFGISYALASLSCGLPVFLTVVSSATATRDFLSGFATFLAYGAGMSMLLVVLTLALALAKAALVRRLRRLLPYVNRVSGAVLLVAGVYITGFWVANLRDPLAARGSAFRGLEEIQRWVGDQLGTRPELWALTLGTVVVVAAAWALLQQVRPGARERSETG